MASAWLEPKQGSGEGADRELLLEDVTTAESRGATVRITTLFGESRELRATIKEVDFQHGRIVLEATG